MKYALLIYENEANYEGGGSTEIMGDMMAKHSAFMQDIGAAMQGGAGLKGISTATTVRTDKGKKTVHDGPFAETKEQLGGFYLVEASDLDAAIAIARKVPLRMAGAIEVRPVLGNA